MPTYEFRCPDGHAFDHFFRSISASQLEMPCPVCGKTAERLMSAGAGLVFKGSGFYITDYGKDGKKDLKPAATEKTESAPTSKSDTSAGGDKKAEPAKPAGPTPPPSTSGGE